MAKTAPAKDSFDLAVKAVDAKLAKDTTHLKVMVSYVKGRGIYMSVTPIKVEDFQGHLIESFMLFSGKRVLLEPAKRLVRSKVAAYFDAVTSAVAAKQGEAWLVVQAVLDECGLALADGVEVK